MWTKIFPAVQPLESITRRKLAVQASNSSGRYSPMGSSKQTPNTKLDRIAMATIDGYVVRKVDPGDAEKRRQGTIDVMRPGADLGMLKGGVKVVFDMRCKVST